MDFPDACIRLPDNASDQEISELCHDYVARLDDWIKKQIELRANIDGGVQAPPYIGTVLSACQSYQKHPHSRFHTVKANTRKTYTDSLKVIEATVGARLIRNVTILDVQNWYNQWRKPTEIGADDDGNPILGPERIDRAHDAVMMFRMVLRFNAALRRKDCKQLLDDLENATSIVRFEKGEPREEQMTLDQARGFIDTALDLGRRDVMPYERALHIAIGVAAQYETLLRQKDIIGEWHKNARDAQRAIDKGATHLAADGDIWTGWFTWENVPGWRWRLKTSKSSYRKSAEHRLNGYSLLMPLLELVPHDRRAGAIVKGEHDLPVRYRSYIRWFRQIAKAAGIPDQVWSMDTRAGGATEAYEAGADRREIQTALTHATEKMTERYIRSGGEDPNVAAVRSARDAARRKKDS